MNLINTPTLNTDRLILRKIDESDMEALLKIYGDREVNIYLPWFPLLSMEEAEIFFEERYRREYKKPSGYKYAICLKSNNTPIGYIHVSTDESHDFGYGLCREFWHKGIVTEAGQAVVERLKEDGMPYITATHDINNPRSGKVMQRLGMRYAYSYEEQWQPKNILVTFRMYQLNLDGYNKRIYWGYWDKSSVRFKENGLFVE